MNKIIINNIYKNGILFITLAIIIGCSSTSSIIRFEYKPLDNIQLFPPSNKRLSLFIEPFSDGDNLIWYQLDNRIWTLEKKPSLYIYEALEKELSRMGLKITKDASVYDLRLSVKLRWFGPYGHNPTSAAIVLAMELFDHRETGPIWQGKIQGGVTPSFTISDSVNTLDSIEKNLTKAFSKTISNLVWNPGFYNTITHLQ